MRSSGRIAAVIEVLEDFNARRVPLKVCLSEWARAHRFAGSKDRAWISGLSLDILRYWAVLGHHMQDETVRARTACCLKFIWDWSLDDIEQAYREEPHGAGALTSAERASLEVQALAEDSPLEVATNMPAWLLPFTERAFGAKIMEETAAFAARASVDLRANSLKADREKALKSLVAIKAAPSELVTTGLRLPVPAAAQKAAAVETIPSFAKGWVEVQDIGSQICALAAGDVAGKQVLDLCAGGGGKTLALSAMANNSGQIFAYDNDARRIAPIFDRLKRAGARNTQVRSPADGGTLDDLRGKMDVVFVDAPCTGAGTWRRRPDTKWRLTKEQLETRMSEQDAVLAEAALYVKSGGVLVYVTCSFLKEENEDRVSAFLEREIDFSYSNTLEMMKKSALLTPNGVAILEACQTPEGMLRLTPHCTKTDGFCIATLVRS